MKALLISANTYTDPYVVYPLGVSIVAAALTSAGHTVRQFDAMQHDEALDDLTRVVGEFEPEIVGIGIRNLDSVDGTSDSGPLFDNAIRIVAHLRQLKSCPIVLGGSGFSLLPHRIMELSGADFGIIGEGEDAIVRLAGLLEAGEAPPERMIHGRTAKQLGALYPPDLLEFYRAETNMAPIQTKRGCDFNCLYCSYPLLEGARVRSRDPEQVIAEMVTLHEQHSVTMFYFVDSVFNDVEGQYIELLDLMARRGLSIPWAAFLTPYKLSAENMDLMVKTGMIWAEIGADATTDVTLKALRKPFTFAEVATVCEELLKRKVSVVNNVMFGGPGETRETALAGIDNLLALGRVYSIVFCGIRVFAGTGMEKLAIDQGIISPDWPKWDSVYYYSPDISRDWLEQALADGFADSQYCVYPPQQQNAHLKMIHRIGYVKFREMSLL